MDPITWVMVLNLIKKYWWVVLAVGLGLYIWFLHSGLKARDKQIEDLKVAIAIKDNDLKSLKIKLDTQSKSIEELAQKGKEQAIRLDAAIKRVNDMKPATQVIVREIYTDSAKNVNDLLFNALND